MKKKEVLKTKDTKENKRKAKTFDEAGRILAQELTPWLIPLVNDFFGENYQGNETIHIENDTLTFGRKLVGNVLITDLVFYIERDGEKNYYHIEFQTSKNDNMVVRMVQYDIILGYINGELGIESYEIKMPKSSVIYLKPTSQSVHDMTVGMTLPDGQHVEYKIPVHCVKEYTLTEMQEKRLILLYPFILFQAEYAMQDGKTARSSRKITKLLDELWTVIKDDDELNAEDKRILYDVSMQIADALSEGNEIAMKGVDDSIMKQHFQLITKVKFDEGVAEGIATEKESNKKELSKAIDILVAQGVSPDVIEKAFGFMPTSSASGNMSATL